MPHWVTYSSWLLLRFEYHYVDKDVEGDTVIWTAITKCTTKEAQITVVLNKEIISNVQYRNKGVYETLVYARYCWNQIASNIDNLSFCLWFCVLLPCRNTLETFLLDLLLFVIDPAAGEIRTCRNRTKTKLKWLAVSKREEKRSQYKHYMILLKFSALVCPSPILHKKVSISWALNNVRELCQNNTLIKKKTRKIKYDECDEWWEYD